MVDSAREDVVQQGAREDVENKRCMEVYKEEKRKAKRCRKEVNKQF